MPPHSAGLEQARLEDPPGVAVQPSQDAGKDDFATQAGGNRESIVGEFTAFLKENKKWWLAPIMPSPWCWPATM